MIQVERYAHERYDVYDDDPTRKRFAPFTVMAADERGAVERAMDRIADVAGRRRRHPRR